MNIQKSLPIVNGSGVERRSCDYEKPKAKACTMKVMKGTKKAGAKSKALTMGNAGR